MVFRQCLYVCVFAGGGGGIMRWKDTCWQIIWPSVWAGTLHAKVNRPINYKRQAPSPSAAHCLVYSCWPVRTADILFRARRFVIGRGHTAQTLTRATLEPLSHPSTSTSHRLGPDNTRTVLMLERSCVRYREHKYGLTPGMRLDAARSTEHLLHQFSIKNTQIIAMVEHWYPQRHPTTKKKGLDCPKEGFFCINSQTTMWLNLQNFRFIKKNKTDFCNINKKHAMTQQKVYNQATNQTRFDLLTKKWAHENSQKSH